MKKIFLLLTTITGILTASAQTLVISNGEDIGLGWWPAGSAGEVGVWNNYVSDANNSTSKAMTVWINNADFQWTGGGMGGLNIDVATYSSISVMIYKQIVGTVRLELQDGMTNYFVTAEYINPGTWQKLEFAIPTTMGNITTLLVAPHFVDYATDPIPDGEAHRMWWDEVVAHDNNSVSIGTENNDTKEIVLTQIYSLNGTLLKTLDKNETKDQSDLQNGVYIVKKTDRDGKISTSKYIKH